jgi:predicted anti-sigma-YlaC factor YlaD
MHRTITCRQVREGLREYLDEAAPLGGAVPLEDHLRSCAECSDHLRELRRTTELLASLSGPPMPASMKALLLGAFREPPPT